MAGYAVTSPFATSTFRRLQGNFICFVEHFVEMNLTRIVDKIPQDIFDQADVGESLLIPRK